MGQQAFVWEHYNIYIGLTVTGSILGSMKRRNICIMRHFILWRKTDRLAACCFSTWICTGVDERPVVFHASGVCLAFSFLFFFWFFYVGFFFFFAWTLIKWTAAIITSSEPAPDPPPPNNNSHFQLWEGPVLSLPSKEKTHYMKCKPVAPPETTGPLRDCSVFTDSHEHSVLEIELKK